MADSVLSLNASPIDCDAVDIAAIPSILETGPTHTSRQTHDSPRYERRMNILKEMWPLMSVFGQRGDNT